TPLLEAGGKRDFRYGDELAYEPVKVDRALQDGERVELGGTVLVANLTPGHTKGCTSWSMDFAGHRAVFLCSVSRLDYRLVGNAAYPAIAEDFRETFRKLRALKPDVFLGAHASFFHLAGKRAAGGPDAFVDAAGYLDYVAGREKDFLAE